MSVNSSQICKEAMTGKHVFVPTPLYTLLTKVKEVHRISTLEQVMDGMKDYIYKNQLFDPKNPSMIYCKNDALSCVLGVPQFSLRDIKQLVVRQLMSADCSYSDPSTTNSCTDEATYCKRKTEETYEEANKRSCSQRPSLASPVYLYIPSPAKYNSDSETALSIQGYETAYVKDSSDDLWYLESDHEGIGDTEKIIAIEEMYNVEYEVETDSCDNDAASVTDTESEVEDILKAAIFSVVSKTDSDQEFWADHSSEEEMSSDVEISDSDKWKCEKCGCLNKPPMRHCFTCWDQRKGWLPDRVERRVSRRKKPRARRKNSAHEKEICEISHTNSDHCNYLSQPYASQDSVSSSQDSVPAQDSKGSYISSDKCILCCVKTMNATIVHGKIGHQFSCYRCARKLQSQNKPCPICRRTIERVIHQIVITN